jgi:hypothetical protein
MIVVLSLRLLVNAAVVNVLTAWHSQMCILAL